MTALSERARIADRNRELIAYYFGPPARSLRECEEKFGISFQRVRQILKAAGLATHPPHKALPDRAHAAAGVARGRA